MAKVCHLRQENQIASNLVAKHMKEFCRQHCGNAGDLGIELNKALRPKSLNGILHMDGSMGTPFCFY